jgi:hypothetical protein
MTNWPAECSAKGPGNQWASREHSQVFLKSASKGQQGGGQKASKHSTTTVECILHEQVFFEAQQGTEHLAEHTPQNIIS